MYTLRYISFKKIINIIKVYLSYSFSVIFKRVVLLGNPFALSTEPTNHCNLRCVECPTGNGSSKRKKGYLDFSLYERIIDEIKNYIIYQMIYFQGEPFLNPDIFKIIKYADQNKIYTCTSTNGHFLNQENCTQIIKSGLKKIIVSMDGATQETYERYRISGDLQTVLEGIETLAVTKKKLKSNFPLIHLQFIVFKHNQHEINNIRKIYKSLGINKLELKSAQVENPKNFNLIPDIQKYSRYRNDKNGFKIKSRMLNRCFRIWSTLVVSWDGNIVPCCYDKELEFIMGNTYKDSVLNVWKSIHFTHFRKNILLNRKKNAICRNCADGLRIRA